MVRRTLLAGVTAALLLATAPGAQAAVTVKKSIWGPVQIDGASQFPIYADLGAGIYQLTLNWDAVAPDRPQNPRDPADPAYRWHPDWDLAVAEAARYGIRVSFAVVGTPRWANGGREWRHAPSRPSDFADFVEAAARRYPAVRHWLIWIEPTKASNFQPLQADRGRRLRGKGLRGPRRYAQLVDASYTRLKALSSRNLVIGGNTFTVGTVSPRRWIEALKLPNGRRPRMDMWGHNPFSSREPRLSRRPLGGGFADFSDLDTLVRWLDRARRRAPAGTRRLKLFLSEFSLPTDHDNHEFNFWVTRATQARWLAAALRIARGWSRIYTLGYLGLYDDPQRPDGDQVERGLIDRSGNRKAAYDAFKRG